jgi:DNA primase
MMDADPAGKTAAPRICQCMGTHPNLAVASIPDGLDPDDLTDEQLQAALQPFLL